MRRVIIVLIILLAPMSMVTRGTAVASSAAIGEQPLVPALSHVMTSRTVEPMLLHELSTLNGRYSLASSGGCRALLQFDHVLSRTELATVARLGVDLRYRHGTPVRVGELYLASVRSAASVHRLEQLGLLRAFSGSKKFYPSLVESVPWTGADQVWHSLHVDGQAIDGYGVRVAVLDTGVDWLHPSFWRRSAGPFDVLLSDGAFYVDLDRDGYADDNEGPVATVLHQPGHNYDLSSDYMFIDVGGDGHFTFTDGDRWLGGIDGNGDGTVTLPDDDVVVLGESKVAVLYDQMGQKVYVRGVNLTEALSVTDYHGHGTHVASTIVGGQPGFTQRVGVAPGADLIVVQSGLDSADVLDGISFAIEQDADIINMSFSSYLGFLDGTDPEDLATSRAFIANGTLSSLAAGNLGGRSKHARLTVAAGQSGTVGLSVSNPPVYSYINILWRSTDRDESIIFRPPSGEAVTFGPFESIVGSAAYVEEPVLNVSLFADVSARGTNRLVVQLSEPQQHIDSGMWAIEVDNPSGPPVTVDVYAWDGDWSSSLLRLTDHLDMTHTISSPGTADYGVCVSAFVDTDGEFLSSSSRGPRVDGFPKPEVAAPGSTITAAAPSTTSLWRTRAGTSMAAPHVAGVLALVRQASGRRDPWADYSALVQSAGGMVAHYSTPSQSWGYGRVDAPLAVQYSLNRSLTNVTAVHEWTGIGGVIDDPHDPGISPAVDILSVHTYAELDTLSVIVAFAGPPGLTGRTLSIRWDTDKSLETGAGGADIMVNVTDGTSTAYVWDDTTYQPSTMQVSVTTGAKTVLVTTERPEASGLGRLSVTMVSGNVSDYDTTGYVDVVCTWHPWVQRLQLTEEGSAVDIYAEAYDRDTPSSDLQWGWGLVSTDYQLLNTSTVSGRALSLRLELPSGQSGITWLCLNVSDGVGALVLPPVVLSAGMSANIAFRNVTLDQDTVVLGLWSPGVLSGHVVLDGYLLVDQVYLSLKSDYGVCVNLTLSGSRGVYNFSVTLSGFAPGEYDVYAVAVSLYGNVIEAYAGSIAVVEDTTPLIVIGVGAVAVVVVVVLLKMRGGLRN